MDLRAVTLPELAQRVQSRHLAARELVEVALRRIDELNPHLNAFVALDPEGALADAADVDDRIAHGDDVGPLAGIPIGVKDLEDAQGFVTTHGSPAHAGDPPAAQDSVLVARLRAAGCVIVGKTNTPEFGWKADTDNPVFGPTLNPWDPERSPGGSSGGSAAAVAAGMVPLATGSDGGGSIRIPSALCGLSGLKASLGRVPGGGTEDPGWSLLSTKGPMARRIRDVAYALDCVVGPEPTDLRSLPMPEASWTRSLGDLHAPARVGWSPDLGYAPVDREVLEVCERALRTLESLGTEVVEVPVVFPEDPVRLFLTLSCTYNLRSLGGFRGTEVWERIDPGLREGLDWAARRVSAVDLVKAEDACHHLNLRLVEVLHDVHLLVTPLSAAPTPLSGQVGVINGVEDPNWVRFTYPFNLTRSPAGTVTAGFTASGLPVGLQVIGPQHGDVAVLRLLAVLEDALGLDTRAPVERLPR
ncbi:MAG: amidase [Acidimicrobiales bacterium]|nr:amidase [Acidimicrobiales bacterium]